MAFRALGRHDEARNHAVFAAITVEKNPKVTAEILGAMMRTGTDAPGVDAFVLQFAGSDEPTLAAAARAFLIVRDSVDVCFAVLDNELEKDLWPAPFSVLVEMERQSVVEGIAVRLEQARLPEMRRLALKTLTDIYYRDPTDRLLWVGTNSLLISCCVLRCRTTESTGRFCLRRCKIDASR